jgi:AcrR family transcriptional regulator
VEATAAAKRGRPSTGARERILDAAIEVLKADGYAGLTIAKVAARAGESKPLVVYHYGSKQGLVGAAGRAIAEMITDEVLAAIEEPRRSRPWSGGWTRASSACSTGTSVLLASTSISRRSRSWTLRSGGRSRT